MELLRGVGMIVAKLVHNTVVVQCIAEVVIGVNTPIIGGGVSQPQLLQSVPYTILLRGYHSMPYYTIYFCAIYHPVEGLPLHATLPIHKTKPFFAIYHPVEG